MKFKILCSMPLILLWLLFPSSASAVQRRYPVKLMSPTKRYILIENGRRTSYYEITPKSPLKVKIEGPLTIVLEMRLNLDALSPIIPSLVDLIIERDEETYDVYRVVPSGVAKERYAGIKDIIPSTKTKFRIDVPPGPHTYIISISSSATLGATLRFTIPERYILKQPPAKKGKPKVQAPPKPKKAVEVKKVRKRIIVYPFFIAGATVETYSDTGFFIKGGAELSLKFTKRLGLNFTVAGAYYPTRYYTYDESTYDLIHPSVSEVKAEVTPLFTFTAYGNEFDSTFIEPAIGLRYIHFIASDFTKLFLGPGGGIRFGVKLFKKVSLKGNIMVSYNPIDSDGNKAVTGNPKVDMTANLSAKIPLKKAYNLRIGGDFEVMGYPKTTLVYGSIRTSLEQNIRFYGGLSAGVEF